MKTSKMKTVFLKNTLLKYFPVIFLLTNCIESPRSVLEDKEQINHLTPTQEASKSMVNLKIACGFESEILNKNVYTFDSDNDAELAIAKIMNLTGLPSNFKIKAANVDNAAATILCLDSVNCIRYILYNQEFMETVKNNSKSNFAELSILAHEIGHHLSGHTLLSSGNNHDQELEADRFSGFILYKLGATLGESQIAVDQLCSEKGSLTHPPKSARLAAIANGWYSAKNGSNNSIFANTNPDQVISETNPPKATSSTKSNSSKINEIKYLIENYSIRPSGNDCHISFNSNTKTLIIDKDALPLNKLKISYDYTSNKHWVKFECNSSENCLPGTNHGPEQSMAIPFSTKNKCMELISLIEELQ